MGVALATTFVIAVGATTMRYTVVIKEMNVLFNEQVMVASKDALIIQAIPITGGMLPQDSTLEMVRNITGVEKAVPILFTMGVGEIIKPVPVNFSFGVPVTDWQLILGQAQLRGSNGHFPTNESNNEVIVGVSLADQYNWTVGTELVVNNYELNITGIVEPKLAILSRSVIMPLELAQKVYNRPGGVNIISVKPTQGYSQEKVAEAINQNVDYVNALTDEQRNDMIQPVLAQVETWNRGIQAVILFMSLILVMTVTIMSVSERRRDFATLDAIGAPLNYVFRVVIIETLLIGVLGGLFGILSGSLSALVLASLYTSIPLAQFFPSILDIVPPLYMLMTFSAVVGVCCVGGIIPALSATRMRIAEVLRAEY
jgi:ABC-type lipoprotein release transport system permease subunit